VLAQTVFVPSNSNLNFIQSSVEQLAGDSDLIGIRSRASGNRPFVVVNKMETAAQQKYQSKIDELEDNLNPIGRAFYGASTLLCTPASLSQEVGLALGAQAGEKRLREVVTTGGFSHFRRATQTPFNLIFEARP